MPDAAQKSHGTIGMANPKFDVIIRPCANCILKLCSDNSFVFRKNRCVKKVKWKRALAGIETVEAGVFVRRMEDLPRGQVARPAADVSQALRFRQVRLLSPQLLSQ